MGPLNTRKQIRSVRANVPGVQSNERQPREQRSDSISVVSLISLQTLSQKRAGGPSGHCARNISDGPTKHTKTNPQRPGECAWSPKPTGGNRVNRGSIPSPLPPWPPVQNSSVACLRRTTKLTDRHKLTYEDHKTPRQNTRRNWRFGA